MLSDPRDKNTAGTESDPGLAGPAAADSSPDMLDSVHPDAVSGESLAIAGSPPKRKMVRIALVAVAITVLAAIVAGFAIRYHAEQVRVAALKSTLLTIESIEWNWMSEEDKLDVLRPIVEAESNALGIYPVPTLSAEDLDVGAAAIYRPTDNEICLDSSGLSILGGHSALFHIFHECFHALQYKAIANPVGAMGSGDSCLARACIEIWRAELADYVAADEDYKAYSSQYVEISAEDYAKLRIHMYEALIADE